MNCRVGKSYYPQFPHFKVEKCLVKVNGGQLCNPVEQFGSIEKCKRCGVMS